MINLTYHQLHNFPIIILDNFYNNEESEKIWQELCFLNNDPRKLKTPEELESAWAVENGKKVFLKNNRGIILDSIYSDRSVSNILTENRKIFDKTIINNLTNLHIFFRYLETSNSDITKVHYYENLDYYKGHWDQSIITAVYWTYKSPKSFNGGNLVFENELTIDCVSNRMVIFPSVLTHEVTPICIEDQLIGKNFGRYGITQFIGIK
jgi:Rps23 Pro-64 3,4-dihydroxylase Tpa1-like proline 4-hydroxylase